MKPNKTQVKTKFKPAKRYNVSFVLEDKPIDDPPFPYLSLSAIKEHMRGFFEPEGGVRITHVRITPINSK